MTSISSYESELGALLISFCNSQGFNIQKAQAFQLSPSSCILRINRGMFRRALNILVEYNKTDDLGSGHVRIHGTIGGVECSVTATLKQ